MGDPLLRVHYLELTRTPAPIPQRDGDERVCAERLGLEDYLALYKKVGAPLRWDQRIWLHTDDWDHPSAIPIYERAGFRVYLTRQEEAGPL